MFQKGVAAVDASEDRSKWLSDRERHGEGLGSAIAALKSSKRTPPLFPRRRLFPRGPELGSGSTHRTYLIPLGSGFRGGRSLDMIKCGDHNSHLMRLRSLSLRTRTSITQ